MAGSATQGGGIGEGLAPLLASSVLFGAMAVSVKFATRSMPPVQVACLRFTGSFLVLLLATRGRGLVPAPGNLLRVVLRGAIGACAITLYFVGIDGAGAAVAALLQSTYPVFAAALAVPLLGERFTRRTGAGLALDLAGAALVLGGGTRFAPAMLPGMLAASAAAVLSGAAIATARGLRASESASLITTWFMAIGALATAPSLASGLPPLHRGLVFALACVVLFSVAAQWLLHHSLGHHSAARASLVAATGVATAALLESLLLGGEIDRSTIAGAILMMAAVGVASGEEAGPGPVGPDPVPPPRGPAANLR
ncbi:MAG: DMT family transporter [Alphaproteobacteria bacterium]